MRITHHAKSKHRMYYFLLALLLTLGLLATVFSAGYPKVQMELLLLTTFAYTLVGVLHHYLEHDATLKIVIEYVLIGSLGMAIIVFLFR